MDKEIDEVIANIILEKTGITEYRSSLVDELEKEIATIYSEENNIVVANENVEPVRYDTNVNTLLDLVANGEIHNSLYKQLSNSQRYFFRKLTYRQDLYVPVTRGSGNNFTQTWRFKFNLKNIIPDFAQEEIYSFNLVVGVRDLYPYSLKITDYVSPEAVKRLADFIKMI